VGDLTGRSALQRSSDTDATVFGRTEECRIEAVPNFEVVVWSRRRPNNKAVSHQSGRNSETKYYYSRAILIYSNLVNWKYLNGTRFVPLFLRHQIDSKATYNRPRQRPCVNWRATRICRQRNGSKITKRRRADRAADIPRPHSPVKINGSVSPPNRACPTDEGGRAQCVWPKSTAARA